MDRPFVLVTYTIHFGQVPETTLEFLEDNHKNMVGVASTGNRNWGDNFAVSADIISEQYGIPMIAKIEMSGTEGDVNKFKEGVLNLEMDRIKQ